MEQGANWHVRLLQTEKSFQKQLGVNVGFGKKVVKKVPGKHGLR